MAADFAKELRQQGIAAAKAGQKDEARHLLQQSIRLEPNSEAAWLWLASVARETREREFCLQKILEINPNNETANKALEQLQQEQAASAPPTPSPASAPAMPSSAPASSASARAPQSAAPVNAPTASSQPRSKAKTAAAARYNEAEILAQPPGVPLPSADQLAAAQQQAESIVRAAQAPLPAETRWVHKTRNRAGEGDVVVLRLYVAGGVAAAILLIAVLGVILVTTNEDVRSIVFAPTLTYTPTPTITPTFTPGITPTPSPLPARSPTPTPFPPQQLAAANPFEIPPATDVYPPILERAVQDAVAAINSGNGAAALPTLQAEERLTENSFQPNPYYYQAMAYLQGGDTAAAIDVLEDAEGRLEEAPNSNFAPLVDSGFAQVYWALAQNAQTEGDTASASEYVDQLITRAETAMVGDPRIAEPYVYLARAQTYNRQFSAALETLDQGLAREELRNNANLLIEKGHVYLAQREYDLADYQGYLAQYVDPITPNSYTLRIAAAMAEDEPGRAIGQAQTYLLYYPGSTEAWKLLGDARLMEGNDDLALIAYSQALQAGETDPLAAETLLARAAVYESRRQYDLAVEDYSRALSLQGDRAIQVRRMMAAYYDGRYQQAYDDATDLSGRNILPQSELDLWRARILVDSDTPIDGVTSSSNRALNLLLPLYGEESELDPALRPIANEALARAYLDTGSPDGALQAVEAALLAESTPARHLLRGQILEQLEQFTEARREYEWVIAYGRIAPIVQRVEAEDLLAALGDAETQPSAEDEGEAATDGS